MGDLFGGEQSATTKMEPWGPQAKQLKKIFELFYRAENELTRETVGTGIGLAIVRKIAESHGGSAWVESAPGEGAASFGIGSPSASFFDSRSEASRYTGSSA